MTNGYETWDGNPKNTKSLFPPPPDVLEFLRVRGEDPATTKMLVWWNKDPIHHVPAISMATELVSVLRGRYEMQRWDHGLVAIFVTREDVQFAGRSIEMVECLFDRLDRICATCH